METGESLYVMLISKTLVGGNAQPRAEERDMRGELSCD
jgi:hypothetical protein